MVGKIWRAIKKGVVHFHYDERGDPATFAGIAAIIGPVAGAALAPEEQVTLGYEQDPEYQKIAREWAEQHGEEYPEFPGMPGQLDTMGTRIEEMLGGELSPAVQQYLGYKYNQAWESAQAGYADIGAGPGTLASQKIQMGERQAIQGAYMGQEQIAKGMEYMPQYTQMMLSPYMADVREWGSIADLIGQNFPGAAPGGTTPTAPTTPTQTEDPSKWAAPTSQKDTHPGYRYNYPGTWQKIGTY